MRHLAVLLAAALTLSGCISMSSVKFQERPLSASSRFKQVQATQSLCEVEQQMALYVDDRRQLWLACPYRYEGRSVPLVAFVGPDVRQGASEFLYARATEKMATMTQEKLRACGRHRFCADLDHYGYFDFSVEVADNTARISYADLSSGLQDLEPFYALLGISDAVPKLEAPIARQAQPARLIGRIQRLETAAQLQRASEQLNAAGMLELAGIGSALDDRRTALRVAELRQQDSFAGYRSAYELSGDEADLQGLQRRAGNPEEKAAVFQLLVKRYVQQSTPQTLAAMQTFAITPDEQAQWARLKAVSEQAEAAERQRQEALARRAEDRRLGRIGCSVTRGPSARSGSEETHQLWGDCDSDDVGTNGIVVSSYKGVPVSLRCMTKRSYSDTIGEFDDCKAYWAKLPGFCAAGDYKGQCKGGVPNGAGVRHTITYTRTEMGGAMGIFAAFARPQEAHEIARGMFKDGKLDGFGNFFSISGCGMAGCSGNRVNQTGWFEQGQFRFECASVQDCASRVSGAAFTSRFRPPDNAAAALARATQAPAASFEEAIARFERSGHIDDLKAARSLARTPAHQAVMEFNLLRTAGFEKGLTVTARLVQGERSVPVEDSQRLLGFYRTVDSTLPLRLQWQIAPNPAAVALRLGQYRVKLRLGVQVKSTTRTCLGSACNDRNDTQTVAQSIDALLTPARTYRANGEVTLMAPGAGTSMMFGVASLKDVKSTEPLVAIESVVLAP